MERHKLSRREVLALMSAPVTVAGSGTFTAAHAEPFWQAVGDVHIGGVHFSVGVHSRGAGYYDRRPGYYYRTTHRLQHGRHRCGPYCYGRGGYAYHHASCPLLGAHVERYGGYDYGWRERYHRPGRPGRPGRPRHPGHPGRGRGHRRRRGRGHWRHW